MTLSIAHRGEPIGHVENTAESIDAGFAAGADMVEIDVRLTADGQPVILHDETLFRIWGLDRAVAEMTAAEVASVRGPAGVRIPALAEVAEIARTAGGQLMVDLPAAEAGPVAFDRLGELGMLDSSLFAGFSRPLRTHAPAARIALTWDDITMPDEATLAFFRPEYFNPHFQLLTASIADRMHAAGIGISVWTVDHPRDMAAVITQGADAVITNRIADLLELIGSTN